FWSWLSAFASSHRMRNLSGKHVFITSCNTRLGNSLAKWLDKRGFCVTDACATEKGGQELRSCSSLSLETVNLNLADSNSIARAVVFVTKEAAEKLFNITKSGLLCCVTLNLLLCDTDISKVIKCMEHALIAKYPRARYRAGWDAKFFRLFLSYAPSCLSDMQLCMTFPAPAASGRSVPGVLINI
uniref:Uncharacterized protein n=1 Tax=Strix occidentalis caurina TaxID=311401 RepID=A0A8D0L0T9_STROC